MSDKPDAVWAVKGYSAYLYTKEAKDFREKEILKFDDANATQVTVHNSKGALSVRQSRQLGGDRGQKAHSPLGPGEGQGHASRLQERSTPKTSATASRWPTRASTSRRRRSTFTQGQRRKPSEILVGKVATGTNHWVKRGEHDAITKITNYASEWAMRDKSKYQAPGADAGARWPRSGNRQEEVKGSRRKASGQPTSRVATSSGDDARGASPSASTA